MSVQVIQSGEQLITLYKEVFNSEAGQLVLDHLRQLHKQPLQQWCDNQILLGHAAGRCDVITAIENVLAGNVLQIKDGEIYERMG